MSAAEAEIIDVEATELVPYTPKPMNLFGSASPAETVAQAAEYADALAEVIQRKKLFKQIQGKPHVLVEGWTLLGAMLGVFPVLESADPVDFDGVKGWRATVTAQTRGGDVVGRATALCLRSEKRWKDADDYAVLSMAQTRATSKALRAPLGFIIQLAGFSPTPEAEIPGDDAAGGTTAATAPPQPPRAEEPASRDQHAKHNALLAELEQSHPRPGGGPSWTDMAREFCRERFGVSSRSQLTKQQMTALIDWTLSWKDAASVPFGEGPPSPSTPITDYPKAREEPTGE